MLIDKYYKSSKRKREAKKVSKYVLLSNHKAQIIPLGVIGSCIIKKQFKLYEIRHNVN